jgi:photosystem II stability/assembly factor-like uncharacterized protein
MKSGVAALLISLGAVQCAHAQWSVQPSLTTNKLFGVSFTSSLKGWAIGENGTMIKTTNGGSTWETLPSPASSNLNDLKFVDSLRGWIVGDNNTILSTTDGGGSWNIEYDNQPFFAHYYGLSILTAGTASNIWAVGGRSYTGLTLITSSSGNNAWNLQNLGFANRLVGVDFLDGNTGWTAGDGGTILKTTNGGRWWNQVQSGTTIGLNGIRFRNPHFGIAVGDSGIILKTTDGGDSWKVINWGGNSLLFKVEFTDDRTAYAVGANGTILKSSDRGERWSRQAVNGNPANVLQDIFFFDKNEGWAVGHGGMILHTTNGGDVTSLTDPPDDLPPGYNLRQSYPNPFNPSSVIEYTLPNDSYVKLTIYDALGREIATLADGTERMGDHAVRWSADGLASGVYFYRLQAGSFSAMRRMVLAR